MKEPIKFPDMVAQIKRRNKEKILVAALAAALSMVTGSCAHKNLESTSLQNSTLSNMNPAPSSMAPPSMDGRDPATIDPTHLRTQADYHFAMGEALSLDGESQRAIESFKLATVYDPSAGGLRLRLAAEYLKQGLMSESIEQAEEAVKLDPSSTDNRVFLGGVFSSLKMYPQAEEQYQAILAKDPHNSEVMIYMGALFAERDSFEKAEEYFTKAARAKGNERSYLAYFYLAKMHLGRQERKIDKAIQAIQKSLSEKPDFEEGVLTLADIFELQNQQPKSIALLESFQRQFGPKKTVAEQLSQIYLEKEQYGKAFEHLRTLEGFDPMNLNVKVKIALILIEQKKYEEAILRLEQILSVAPSSDKIRYYLAAVYEEVENLTQAVNNYRQIDKTSTYFPDANVRAANLLKRSNQIDKAIEHMQSAVEQRDDAPAMYAFYASLLDESKNFQKGVSMLESAVKRFPENTQLLFYLGNLYDRVGKVDKSIDAMKKVIALDDKHVQALNYLAYTYAERNMNLDEAEKMALRALDMQPDDGYILDTVGWVYFRRGQVEEAIRYLETAQRQKPNESVIAEHLGDAYYVFELKDKAKEMYLRAVALETDQDKASKIRAKIATISEPQKDQFLIEEKRAPASVSDGE